MIRRTLAVALALLQLTLALTSCVSVRATGTHPANGAGGGVAVQVFANDSARKAARPGPSGILGELQREENGRWVTVFRSLNPTWTVAGLPEGAYRVAFPARLDDAGSVVRIDSAPTSVKVQESKLTEVQAVLDHIPTALIVVGVVTVVVAAVLLADYLKDHGLPLPPPPPPGLVEAAFYISLDVMAASDWTPVERHLPPVVTSHFPASGALVAARRPRVIFSLSEPLQPTSLHAEAVTVLGEASGLIPGQVIADAEHWWVVWEPRADLPAGDTFHVTLAKDGVEDAAGSELTAPATFAFRTAR
ncbi:MAG: Ig-like domain-containing protein [Thermoanaerobaculales bacterium]